MDPGPQLQAPSPAQAADGVGRFGGIHRSGPASRGPAVVGQLPRYAAAAGMSFPAAGAQVSQQLSPIAAMLGQGQPRMLQGQGSAAHYGLQGLQFQSPMMAQPSQRGTVQGAQFSTANAAQGGQSMGGGVMAMGTSGLNQMRPNGISSPYGAQQRFAPGQMRPQQLSGSPQIGHTMQMSPMQQQQQQQWPKQMQSSTASPAPSHKFQQEQMMLLIHQLRQRGLNDQQIAHTIKQIPRVNAQQLNQQQLRQQQQSPRMPPSASQNPAGLAGLQPVAGLQPMAGLQPGVAPLSGGAVAGVSTSRPVAPGTSQLLGKRKIQDLVAQLDPLGKVDPEVEDLMLEIADDFITSATAFACKLAKHRKSSVVEAKDMLLHLEKHWHLSVPGFSQKRM